MVAKPRAIARSCAPSTERVDRAAMPSDGFWSVFLMLAFRPTGCLRTLRGWPPAVFFICVSMAIPHGNGYREALVRLVGLSCGLRMPPPGMTLFYHSHAMGHPARQCMGR